MKIAMHDDDCVADISCEFVEFCRKNGKVIARRIGPFFPARLLFPWALDRAQRGGRGPGGHCSANGDLQGMSALRRGKSSVRSMRDPICHGIDQDLLIVSGSFEKIIARVHASGLCYCKSRVSSSACRQLGDRGVHVSS